MRKEIIESNRAELTPFLIILLIGVTEIPLKNKMLPCFVEAVGWKKDYNTLP